MFGGFEESPTPVALWRPLFLFLGKDSPASTNRQRMPFSPGNPRGIQRARPGSWLFSRRYRPRVLHWVLRKATMERLLEERRQLVAKQRRGQGNECVGRGESEQVGVEG